MTSYREEGLHNNCDNCRLTFSERNNDVHIHDVDAVGFVELEWDDFTPHPESQLQDSSLIDQRNLSTHSVRQEAPPHRTVVVLLEPSPLGGSG